MAMSIRNLVLNNLLKHYRTPKSYFHVSAKTRKENTELTICKQENGVCRIHMNDSKKRNALSLTMLGQIKEDLSRDFSEVKCIVISGEGPAFSAGHNLKELTAAEGRQYHEQVFSKCTEVMKLIRDVPAPVIAEVDGIAAAAGCQLVAACDIAIATERSTFSTPGVAVGLFCSTPGVAVARAVHKKVAMEMLFTGRPITAQEAMMHGLISRVVPNDGLESAIDGLTRRICELSQPVAALGKQFFYQQIEMSLDDAYQVGGKVMVDNLEYTDAQEGINAFFQKRHPKWS